MTLPNHMGEPIPSVRVHTNRSPDPVSVPAIGPVSKVAETAAFVAGFKCGKDVFSLRFRGGYRDAEVLHPDAPLPDDHHEFDLSITGLTP